MSDTKSHQKASASASNPSAGGGESADANKAAADTATSTSAYKPPSKYRFVKDGWGSRTNFQMSHGLKMGPDDLEEGQLILEAYIEHDRIQHGDLAYEDRKVINMEPRDKSSSPSRATR